MKTEQPIFDESKSYGEQHQVGSTLVTLLEQDGSLFDGVTREFVRKVTMPKAAKTESPHRFNADKPHGIVMDPSDLSVRYSQDGKLFAADGSFVRAE